MKEDAMNNSATIWHEITAICPRCTGRGTHYLTCPTLRLPDGYTHATDEP